MPHGKSKAHRQSETPPIKVYDHEAEESNCARSRSRAANPVMVTPHWKNRQHHSKFKSSLLKADTIIATCGLSNVEDSTFSNKFRYFVCPPKVKAGLLTPGHKDYDEDLYVQFMRSFRINFPDLCAGRENNIIVIDCTVIQNPEHKKKLRNHLGTHPETWAMVVAHNDFEPSHRKLTKLSTTEKNLIISVCKSGCHRSLASAYSIEHAIKTKVYGADPDMCVQTINLQEQHHYDQKCRRWCKSCNPAQTANDDNRASAYRKLEAMIPGGKGPRSTSYEQPTPYWPDRRISVGRNKNDLPPITRKRRHPNDDCSPTSRGGAHPTIHRTKAPRSTSYEPSQRWPDAHNKTPMPSDCVHHTTKRGRSPDRPSMPSGGVHPTKAKMDSKAKTVFLFTDSSTYHTRIADQLQADIVVTDNTQSSHEVQWQVRPKKWLSVHPNGLWRENLARKEHVLAESSEATITTLTRSLPGDIHEVKVILARIIKESKAVIHKLCDLLIRTKQPALVLANVRTSTDRMSLFVEEYNDHKSSADQRICIIHNDKQAICLALATFAQARQLVKVEITATTEPMLAVQLHLGKVSCTEKRKLEQPEPAPKKKPKSLTTKQRATAEWDNSMADARREQDDAVDFDRYMNSDPRRKDIYTARNNDGVHLVDNQKKKSSKEEVISRSQQKIALLANVNGQSEHDHREKWIKELRRQCSTKGTQCTSPIKRMHHAFSVIRSARNQVMNESSDNTKLTEEQYQKALEYMQYHIFETCVMENEDLKRRIQEFKAQPNSLKGKAKTNLQNLRRGAFKTWKWQLLGSQALLDMILRHGIFDAGKQRCYLLAFEQDLEVHKLANPTIDPKSQTYKDIRNNANKARDEERRANKLSLQVVKEVEVKSRKMAIRRQTLDDNFEELIATNLSPDDQLLLTALEAGKLKSTREAADDRLGHGRNIIPKRGAVMFQAAYTRAFGNMNS